MCMVYVLRCLPFSVPITIITLTIFTSLYIPVLRQFLPCATTFPKIRHVVARDCLEGGLELFATRVFLDVRLQAGSQHLVAVFL